MPLVKIKGLSTATDLHRQEIKIIAMLLLQMQNTFVIILCGAIAYAGEPQPDGKGNRVSRQGETN